MVTSSHIVTSLDEEMPVTMPVHHIDMVNNGQEEAFFSNNSKILIMPPGGPGRNFNSSCQQVVPATAGEYEMSEKQNGGASQDL